MAISDYISTSSVINAAIHICCLAGVLCLFVNVLIGGESPTEYDAKIMVWGTTSFFWFLYKVIVFVKWYLRASTAMGLTKVRGGDRTGDNRKERRKQANKEDTIRRAGFSRR
jgi:hypothetical protein